jgi:hypothetical protein
MERPFSFSRTIGESLRTSGVEFDQKLHRAFRQAAQWEIFDSNIFHALNVMNVVSTQLIDINAYSRRIARSSRGNRGLGMMHLVSGWDGDYKDRRPLGFALETILNTAYTNRSHDSTISSADFLRALASDCLTRLDSIGRPRTADLLALIYCGEENAPLSQSALAMRLLEKLSQLHSEAGDFQYFLALERGRIVFRVASVLGDYVQRSSSGVLVPQRAILTHFQDQFGGFLKDEIEQLQDLLNSSSARESDFQRFFEGKPYFLRKWDHREVYSQVALSRSQGNLIPDFILTDRELQKAAILDLKLPSAKLIRRQTNRDRFTSAVVEARTQLLRYRDWFRDSSNRRSLVERVGMEIYEPELIVVIGRSSEFLDALDRQTLVSDMKDIQIVTYDDLVNFAARRRIIITGNEDAAG